MLLQLHTNAAILHPQSPATNRVKQNQHKMRYTTVIHMMTGAWRLPLHMMLSHIGSLIVRV